MQSKDIKGLVGWLAFAFARILQSSFDELTCLFSSLLVASNYNYFFGSGSAFFLLPL